MALTDHLKELKQAFMKWGYKDQFLEKQFKRLSTIETKSLLTPKSNNVGTNRNPVVLTDGFNQELNETK